MCIIDERDPAFLTYIHPSGLGVKQCGQLPPVNGAPVFLNVPSKVLALIRKHLEKLYDELTINETISPDTVECVSVPHMLGLSEKKKVCIFITRVSVIVTSVTK